MKLMSFDHESFLAFSLKPQMDANIYRFHIFHIFHIFLTPLIKWLINLTHSPRYIYPWRWSYVHLTDDVNEKSTSNLNIYSTTKTIYIQIQIACVLEWSEFFYFVSNHCIHANFINKNIFQDVSCNWRPLLLM